MTQESASFAHSSEDTTICEGQEWFVATVKPLHELTVAEGFESRGFKPFCPTYEIRRQHKRADRRTLRPPLFPGYVFCRFHRNDRTAVLRTPGVRSIIAFGGTAAAVDHGEIDRLRAVVSCGAPVRPWPYLKAGDRVSISNGALKGIDGLVLRAQGNWLLVVSVTILQRSIALTIDRELIAPVWDAPRFRGTSGKLAQEGPCGILRFHSRSDPTEVPTAVERTGY
jgi:transcription antitermination factor NusG